MSGSWLEAAEIAELADARTGRNRKFHPKIYNAPMSLNHELSDLFRNFSAIMEIKGENRFKAIAFSKVSRIVKDLPADVKQLCKEGKLQEVEGLGESSCRRLKR